jgi:hypothetical protein
MAQPEYLRTFYENLGNLGFSKQYVRKTFLPHWWEDRLAAEETAFQQMAMSVASVAQLDLMALLGISGKLELSACRPEFKHTAGIDRARYAVATQLAISIAEIAASATGTPYALPTTASEVRSAILQRDDRPWVDLASLVDYCWTHGVPVLRLAGHLPYRERNRKPQGMVVRVRERIVIVLSGNTSAAHVEFDLAHELGHILAGHLEENDCIVDETLDRESSDDREREANDQALELLCGRESQFYSERWLDAAQLATVAIKRGKTDRIEPGHLVLNFGHTMNGLVESYNGHAVAQKALTIVQSRHPQPDPAETLLRGIEDGLSWGQLDDAKYDYIRKMVGIGEPA